MPIENPILLHAVRKYNPQLVLCEFTRMRQVPRPADLGAMGAVLSGTPLAGYPLVFVAYFIAMNSMNYQFWTPLPDGGLQRYAFGGKENALAMQSAFLHAWLRHMPAEGDAEQVVARAVEGLRAELDQGGVAAIFGEIPAADSRLALLQEVLNAPLLVASAAKLVSQVAVHGTLGWRDAQALSLAFPLAYADDFLKKAQLTLMFIAAEWRSMGGRPLTLDVTAAADYQLPKVLRALGLLTYAPEVASVVDEGRLIEPGSPFELAIRSATVLGCSELAEYMDVPIEALDFWLWQQRNAAASARFHLTCTTHY